MNIKEIPYIFRTMFGAPLDVRFTVSSIQNLLKELPLKTRYEGLIVYVKDLKKHYSFIGGVNDSNFKPLNENALHNTRMLKLHNNESITDLVYIDEASFKYIHNLDSLNVNVVIYGIDDKPIKPEKIEILNTNEIVIHSNLIGLYKLSIHI